MKKILSLLIVSLFLISIIGINYVMAIDRVVYPLYASTCCVSSPGNWVTAPGSATTLKSTSQSYTCPQTTAQCRVRTPVISCPAAGIGNLWLGYTKIWAIQTPGGEVNSKNSAGAVEFQKGQSISYKGYCLNNAIWTVIPVTGLFGLSLISGAVEPTTSSLTIEMLSSHITIYPALEGQYTVPNTELCQMNQQVREEYENLPTNANLGKTSAELARTGASTPSTSYVGLLDSTGFKALDECRLSVDKYIDLPFTYNVNPKGQYSGKDVICSQSKGIVSVVPLSTNGGDTWYVLGQKLVSTGFCCNDQDCKLTNGPNYNCEQGTYTCKQIAGYCNNDLDCQPQGGFVYDSNCIYKDNKFYKWTASCVSNRCAPYPTQLTEQKCCPSYCNNYGQVCNPSTGCYVPTVVQPDCPPGQCCDGVTNKVASCSTGLTCCYDATGTSHVGTCKASCVNAPECTKDADCPSTKPNCVMNKCTVTTEPQTCKWYQEYLVKEKTTYAWYDVFKLSPNVATTSGCYTSSVVTYIGIAIVAGIVIIGLFVYYNPKKVARRKNRRK